MTFVTWVMRISGCSVSSLDDLSMRFHNQGSDVATLLFLQSYLSGIEICCNIGWKNDWRGARKRHDNHATPCFI